jgi:hypothetical protein
MVAEGPAVSTESATEAVDRNVAWRRHIDHEAMILLVKSARRLMLLWAAMWLVSAALMFVFPPAFLVAPLVTCIIGGLAIDATHRALRVDNEMPGVPFLGPLTLCSLDDRLERLPVPNVSVTASVVAAVFAPLWAFFPAMAATSVIARPVECGNAWADAMFALVSLLFASSRVLIAFRIVRTLKRVESVIVVEGRHANHVLPVAV